MCAADLLWILLCTLLSGLVRICLVTDLEVMSCGALELGEDWKYLTTVPQGKSLKCPQAKSDHLLRQGRDTAPAGKGSLAEY